MRLGIVQGDTLGAPTIGQGPRLFQAPSGAMLRLVAADYDAQWYAEPGHEADVLKRIEGRERLRKVPGKLKLGKPAARRPSRPPGPIKDKARLLKALGKAASTQEHRRYALNCLYCDGEHTVAGKRTRVHIYNGALCAKGLRWVHKPKPKMIHDWTRGVHNRPEPQMGAPIPWESVLPPREPRSTHELADVYHWLALALCMTTDSPHAVKLHENPDGTLGMTSGDLAWAGTAEVHMTRGAQYVAEVNGHALWDALRWLAQCGETTVEISAHAADNVRLDGANGVGLAVLSTVGKA